MTASIRYRVCDDRQCLNPRPKAAVYKLTVAPFAPALASFVVPAGYVEVIPGRASESKPVPVPQQGTQQNLAAFVLAAFGFGLAAIFTPCVFPMIPITVSF